MSQPKGNGEQKDLMSNRQKEKKIQTEKNFMTSKQKQKPIIFEV